MIEKRTLIEIYEMYQLEKENRIKTTTAITNEYECKAFETLWDVPIGLIDTLQIKEVLDRKKEKVVRIHI
ncbi:hypothetical protein A4S06_11680 [Erysipelotrichaceae bacterium MTC7]|nr:hypothetical protein A4S06_11680 [Erysipelotrichaceae bacterium MTC7]